MKTLQNTLLTLTLVALATTSLVAMERPSQDQHAALSLKTDLLQCHMLKEPQRVLQSIQTLSQAHAILKCIDIVTAALTQANISLGEIVDENGNTILHLACSNDSSANIVNIILAAEQNEEYLVKLLVAKNKKGLTALDLATTRNQQILRETAADNDLHIEEINEVVSSKVTTSRRSANNGSIGMGKSAIDRNTQRTNNFRIPRPYNNAPKSNRSKQKIMENK